MRFGEFLISRKKITERELVHALMVQHQKQPALGSIALRRRYLTVKQVASILYLQAGIPIKVRETGKARIFGDLAVEFGFLTPAQVEELLVLQLNGRPPIGQVLVGMNLLKSEELDGLLEEFWDTAPIPA